MTLADDLADDLSEVFMDASLGFAVEATTSGAATITGVFTKDYLASDPGGLLALESSEPVFRCITSDATGISTGNKLTINSVVYVIVETQPDESGVTDFRLQAT